MKYLVPNKIDDDLTWSPSYYVESIGTTNQQAVAKYIDDQRLKEVNLNDPTGN